MPHLSGDAKNTVSSMHVPCDVAGESVVSNVENSQERMVGKGKKR